MRSTDGNLYLIDFEDFAYGPREWDAAVLSVRHQAFGWASDAEYRSYADAYGFDPIDWPGFPVVRAARELNMTTWLAQTMDESPEVEAEVYKRLSDLRDDQAPRNWRVF
jgi:thiamine kinase-like enzyme